MGWRQEPAWGAASAAATSASDASEPALGAADAATPSSVQHVIDPGEVATAACAGA